MTGRDQAYAFREGDCAVKAPIGSSATRDVMRLLFKPKANATYWYFICGEVKNTVSSSLAQVDIYIDSILADSVILYPRGAGQLHPVTFITSETFGGSPPSSKRIDLTITAGANTTATLKNATILVLEQVTGDQGRLFTTQFSGTNTTYVKWSPTTDETLTLVPTGAGDYLILAFALCASNHTSADSYIKLTDSTTDWGECQIRKANSGEIRPWGTFVRLTGLSSNKSLEVQCRTSSASFGFHFTAGMVLAIDLSTLDNQYYAETRAEQTVTTPASTFITMSPTTLAAMHIHWTTAQMSHSSSSTSFGAALSMKYNSVQVFGPTHFAAVGTKGDWRSVLSFRKVALPAASNVHDLTLSRIGAIGTAYAKESALACLQLDATTPKRVIPGKTLLAGKLQL